MKNYKIKIIVEDNNTNKYYEIAEHISMTDNIKKEKIMWYDHYAKWLNKYGFLKNNRYLTVKLEKIENKTTDPLNKKDLLTRNEIKERYFKNERIHYI